MSDPVEPAALPSLSDGAARRLRDACEPIAAHAFWSRRTRQALTGLGLDGMKSYVCGRAAGLGRPAPMVVAAAFAWFEPGGIASTFEAGAAAADVEVVVRVRNEAATESLREALGPLDSTWAGSVLAEAIGAADHTGRLLFAGLQAQPVPADPAHRLWWACDAYREHRGDSHTAAAIAAGVGPIEMNILTELAYGIPLLSYTSTRGWSATEMAGALAGLEHRGWVKNGQLTDAGLSARIDIEQSTDRQQDGIVAALGSDVDALCERLDELSTQLIAARAFPSDPAKRAAG